MAGVVVVASAIAVAASPGMPSTARRPAASRLGYTSPPRSLLRLRVDRRGAGCSDISVVASVPPVPRRTEWARLLVVSRAPDAPAASDMAMTSRFPSSFEPNPLTLALRRARAAGAAARPHCHQSDPRRVPLHPAILAAARGAASLIYEPAPLGLRDGSRRRVRRLPSPRRRRSLRIGIVLTASTSEAYAWLFKLLCRPRMTSVLIPAPSYPLFDHLTRLDGVRAVPYRLDYHGRWAIDIDSLDDAWTDEIRAVLVVSPNNPTGSVLGAGRIRGGRRALRGARRGADRRRSVRGLSAADVRARDAAAMPTCVPDRSAGWPVEVGRAAAGQAGMDGVRRPGRAWSASAMRAAGADRRHLSVGLDTGAGRCAGADRVRRGGARADSRRACARNDAALRAAAAPPSRASKCCTRTADGRRCCACPAIARRRSWC